MPRFHDMSSGSTSVPPPTGPAASGREVAPSPAPSDRPRREPLGPLDTGRSTPLPSIPGIALRVLLFLAAAGGTLGVMHAVAAPGGADLIGSKREAFRAGAGRYDTVLLGSSHVYRGVIPAELDARLGAAGVEAHAFNFGIQLPDVIELRYVLRDALAAGHGRVKRVILEYLRMTPQIDPASAFAPRTIYWHDARETALAVQRVEHWADEEDGPFPYVEETRKVADADGGQKEEVVGRWSSTGILDRLLPGAWRAERDHALHGLSWLAMVGRREDIERGLLSRRHPLFGWVSRQDGYASLEEESARLDRLIDEGQAEGNDYARRHAAFLADPEAYQQRIEDLRSKPVVFGDDEWMNAALLHVDDLEVIRRMRDDCRAAGASLVVVVMPANSANRPLESRMESELDVPVLLYDDPARYPAFYDPAMRFDSGHFNAEGAAAFTRVLADDLAALVHEGRLE